MLVIQFCRRAGSRRLMACRAARESRWGENLARKGRRGTERPGQNFKGPGGVSQGSPAGACLLPVCPSVCRFLPRPALPKRVVSVHFRGRFAAVARVAQALEIAGVGKHVPPAFVVNDVVYIRCPCPHAMFGTLPAPRLPQQLLAAECLPLRRLVHPAPRLCLLTARPFLRPVLVTVSAGHQPIAAWIPARS